MKKSYIKLFFLSISISLSSVAMAQSLRSAYFLEGATYRHQLNPAFMGERSYFSFPGLGSFYTGLNGNVGLSDFIYKYDDPGGKHDLTTFMSSTVGKEQFLNRLHSKNVLNFSLDMTLISFGFKGFGGFNTFDIGLRANTISNMPYKLFEFMKTGSESEDGASYRIKGLSVAGNSYAQIAIGHSHKIGEQMTVGAKLKYLVGAGGFDANIQQLDVEMAQDKWVVTANGSLDVSVAGAEFKTKSSEKGREIDDIDVDDPKQNGWGLGMDMGITYQLTGDLSLSASVVDLGFISWQNTIKGKTLNDPYTFDGFENIAVKNDNEGSKDWDEQLDDLEDDLEDLVKLYDQGTIAGRKEMLAATIHLGGEYVMPFYKGLSVGLLSSTRFYKPVTWTEGRMYINLSPLKILDLSANYSISNLGSSMGWILNFHPGGLAFFVGCDQLNFKVTPQYVPVNDSNLSVCLGLNINLGRTRF